MQAQHITPYLAANTHVWMITAGWPCQDYSPAGKGLQGARAALLTDVLRVLQCVQQHAPMKPTAYILENVAMQRNFRHRQIKYPVWEGLQQTLGTPVTFDAARAGSYAHRLRNYWTNLADPQLLQATLDHLACPHEFVLDEILGHRRYTLDTKPGEKSVSGYTVNQPGKPRVTFPTLMSYPFSRAFKPGHKGSIYDAQSRLFDEPSAEEREVIMGFEPSSTAAPELTEQDRRSLLGQSIDLNALLALWHASQQLVVESCEESKLSPEPQKLVSHMKPSQLSDFDHAAFLPVLPVQPEPLADIWEDQETLAFLQQQTLPHNNVAAARVRKRALLFRWFNNRLFKVVHNKDSGNPEYRIVPEPKDREHLVMTMHKDLGHVGEKRTIAAMAQIYWWYGMTLDVRRLVSTCSFCDRVHASPPAEQQEMQTESHHDYGLFYRWGLDYVGELPPSAQGNKYALIFIDYYSKWIEAFPVPTADAITTVRIVLLNLIARYGTPAEIICDNGAPFLKEFVQFCKARHIRQRFITPGLPRSNGLAERAVQTVKHALQKHAAEQHSASTWDAEGLASILLGYRVTPQASTGLSPAQILFAQNPAINADHYASKQPPIDYLNDNASQIAEQLLARAHIAEHYGAQVATNLKLAHERNAVRFKHVRSGIYIPRVYTYKPGDYVFILNPEDRIPGGAMGICARPEILRVIQVKSTGVLILENQAGNKIESHKEKVVPCTLTNVEGTTHPGLIKPRADLACTHCGDHRRAAVMLLCDNCDAPYHTYCLNPPLDIVPEGNWICPECVTAGVSLAQVAARQAKCIQTPESRPALELPSPKTRRKAQKLAETWHGKVVTRDEVNYGRVVFQGPTGTKWFKIHWNNGQVTEHTTRILPHLGIVPEDQAPPDVMHAPEPIRILALDDACKVNWSIRSPEDVQQRMEHLMPGSGDAAYDIFRSLSRRARMAMTHQSHPNIVQSLIAVLHLPPSTILDPWAGNHAVGKGLVRAFPSILKPNSTGPRLVLNDRWGKASLQLEPLEPHLYTKVARASKLNIVISVPPPSLLDIAIVTALEFVDTCVCVYVPEVWLSQCTHARMAFLDAHCHAGTCLQIASTADPFHCWLCIFASHDVLASVLKPGHALVDHRVTVSLP